MPPPRSGWVPRRASLSRMSGRTPTAALAVALSFALLLLHAGAEVLGLPGLVALDVADRVGSVGGIAALTVVLEQALRRRRLLVVPLALAGQLGLLTLPSLLHADAIGASYEPSTLLAGVLLHAALTLAVVAVALRVEEAVAALLGCRVTRPPATLCRATAPRPLPLPSRSTGRPPGRAPPLPLAA